MEEQTKGVKTFISLLIQEFDMEESELLQIWNNYLKQQPKSLSNQFTLTELNKLKKKDLELLCAEKNVSSVGTKQVLISRLLGDNVVVPNKIVKSGKAPTIKDVFRMIKNTEVIKIRRNTFGNYEHLDSKFVFDEIAKKVIGKQHDDGTILPLSLSDIEKCRQLMFDYDIPYTLRDVYEN
jgi:hypothetical protein